MFIKIIGKSIFGRNLWVSGLFLFTRVIDLKFLFSKYGKVCGFLLCSLIFL